MTSTGLVIVGFGVAPQVAPVPVQHLVPVEELPQHGQLFCDRLQRPGIYKINREVNSETDYSHMQIYNEFEQKYLNYTRHLHLQLNRRVSLLENSKMIMYTLSKISIEILRTRYILNMKIRIIIILLAGVHKLVRRIRKRTVEERELWRPQLRVELDRQQERARLHV